LHVAPSVVTPRKQFGFLFIAIVCEFLSLCESFGVCLGLKLYRRVSSSHIDSCGDEETKTTMMMTMIPIREIIKVTINTLLLTNYLYGAEYYSKGH
jgi:hypothetical protein